MSTIIIVFIVWTIAAFIYSKVKGCGMFGAYFKVIFALFAELTSSRSSGNSDLRDKAKRAGRDDIVDACDEADAKRQQMHDFFDNQSN